jgi:hypothetical protein
MSVHLPALPALVAGQALRADAMTAAHRAIDQIRHLLASYDLVHAILDDVPQAARESVAAALHRRFSAASRMADLCRERLDEAAGFCASLHDADSPVTMVEVPSPLFEMLSPYLDDAMDPVLAAISRRVGPGCTSEEVRALFPPPLPA